MKKIGFIGCGKIGSEILNHIREKELAEVVFILDPFFKGKINIPVIEKWDAAICSQADIVIECATAGVLKRNIDEVLAACDLLLFSATAFAEPLFEEKVRELCEKNNRHVYLPHGAILGLDGIFDGRSIIREVSIVTTKNPQSLGEQEQTCTVLYEGTAREACRLYPRNVNVHAEIALAGIGFDKTKSKIVADPSVITNTHEITVEGEGIHFKIEVSSFSTGGVTGAYTPLSACGSVDRLLCMGSGIAFI